MTIERQRAGVCRARVLLLLLATAIGYAVAGADARVVLTPLASAVDQNDLMPSASPNGDLVLFTSRRSGTFRQYIMKVDGSDARVITSGPGRQMQGAWAPDGKRIVYVQRTQREDRQFDRHLVVCNADGSEPRTIAEIPGSWPVAAWSPDGTRILYHAPGPNGGDDIWSVDVASGEQRVVLGSPAADRQPFPSPDGTQIVFISRLDGDDEIYVADLNGGPWTQLTDNDVNDYTPSWSPDGSRIVFQSPRAGRWTIFTIKPDGSDETPITTYPAQYDPVWSADGSEIFFNSDRDGRRGIYVMNADGSHPRKLTNVASSTFVTLVREQGVEEAVQRFREARTNDPDATYFYEDEVRYLADNFLEIGHIRKATLLFEVNVETYPKSKSAHMDLGRAHLAAGALDLAVEQYEAALAIDPDDATISSILGRLRSRR